MKIVIDIPEDVYTRLFDSGIQDNEIAVDDVCEIARALRMGTPLSKGHGRIGDLDTLREEVSSWGMNDYEPSDFIDEIDRADTIIEADKEEENENY